MNRKSKILVFITPSLKRFGGNEVYCYTVFLLDDV